MKLTSWKTNNIRYTFSITYTKNIFLSLLSQVRYKLDVDLNWIRIGFGLDLDWIWNHLESGLSRKGYFDPLSYKIHHF